MALHITREDITATDVDVANRELKNYAPRSDGDVAEQFSGKQETVRCRLHAMRLVIVRLDRLSAGQNFGRFYFLGN